MDVSRSESCAHPGRPAGGSGVARRVVLLLLAILPTWVGAGCVHRRMTVTSNPPGARVLVDGEDAGLTPVSVDFTYYGTREITLIKDGYETLTVMQPVATPWYQIAPVPEFFSDNFALTNVTDRHHFQYDMQRQQQAPRRELLDRANSLRMEAKIGHSVP